MGIREVYTSLKNAFIDWDGFLLNPNYIQRDHITDDNRLLYKEITWNKRNPNYRLKSPVTEADITELGSSSQYSFQIRDDGSIFQFYYQYDRSGEQLSSASMGFYLSISEIDDLNEDKLLSDIAVLPDEAQEPLLGAVIGSIENRPVGWIRIDYDPSASERGIVHHDCHMHLSNFPETRIIVSGIPSPRQFIEFVIASVYPSKYKEHCLELSESEEEDKIWRYSDENRIETVNINSMSLDDNPIYNQLSYFRIPSSE